MCSRRSTRGSGVVKHVASRALVRLRMPATEKADGRAAATRRGVVHHRIEATAGEQAKRPVGGAARQPLHVRAYLQPPFLLHLPLPRPASPPPAAPARPWPPAAAAALATDIAIAIARAARHPAAADRPVLHAAVQHAPRRAGSQHGPSGGPLHRRRGYVVAVAARCVAAQAAPSSRRAPVPVDISNIIIYGRGRACAC